MYDNILFDLDGTLTDPGEGITNSVAYSLGKFGIAVADRSDLYRFIGPPLADSFRDFYGFSESECQLAIVRYREYFAEKGIFENRVYDGIPQLLAELKNSGRHLFTATSKPEQFAVRILEHFGLSRYFDDIVGASMDGSLSVKADVIAEALHRNGISDRKTAVMIGDRLHDIEGANANSLSSIGVLFGYGSREELVNAGASHIADTPSDILRFV